MGKKLAFPGVCRCKTKGTEKAWNSVNFTNMSPHTTNNLGGATFVTTDMTPIRPLTSPTVIPVDVTQDMVAEICRIISPIRSKIGNVIHGQVDYLIEQSSHLHRSPS